MRITRQSIKWLGDNKVRVTTTRSKSKSSPRFHIWFFSVGGGTTRRSNKVTDVIGMDHQRFLAERERIKRSQFRDYDPTKYYEYNENAAYLQEEKLSRGIEKIGQGLVWLIVNLVPLTRKAIQNSRNSAGFLTHRGGSATKNAIQNHQEHRRNPISPEDKTVGWIALTAMLSVTLPFVARVSWVAWIPFLVVWLALPIFVSRDAHRVATHTGYTPHGWFWTLGAAVPMLGAIVGLTYLIPRTHHVPPDV